MGLDVRIALTAMLLGGSLPLAGCGGEQKGGNTVQMKDMEVVDGTATDAMTDLDGVRSEGTAIAEPAGNASNASAAAATRKPRKPEKEDEAPEAGGTDSEILADQ